MDRYVPRMSEERIARLRRWHDRAAAELRALGAHDVDHLGLRLHVPDGVFPPQPMSRLLGGAVLDESRAEDRVLDMGTGCGVNAILAARNGARVVATDVNPTAVAAARRNATAAGVSGLVECRVGDLFDAAPERFDLIVFDPPFRWFAPADMFERAFADDGYDTLGRFFEQVGEHLEPGGRVLLFFGTTGDVDHLHGLVASAGLTCEVLSTAGLDKDGGVETYWAFRLRSARLPP